MPYLAECPIGDSVVPVVPLLHSRSRGARKNASPAMGHRPGLAVVESFLTVIPEPALVAPVSLMNLARPPPGPPHRAVRIASPSIERPSQPRSLAPAARPWSQ